MHKTWCFNYHNVVLFWVFFIWLFPMTFLNKFSFLGTFIGEKTSLPLNLLVIFCFPFLLSLLRSLFQTLAALLSLSSCSKSQIWTEMCPILLLHLGALPFSLAWTTRSFNTDTHLRWKSDAKEESGSRPFCMAVSNDVGCIFLLLKKSVSSLVLKAIAQNSFLLRN